MAREQALQALYSIEIAHADPSEAVTEIVPERAPGEHRTFVRDLVLGTVDHEAELDARLTPLLEGWSLERLPVLDRLILRMGAFELQYRPETPSPVVLNEAVELAKKYSTEDSGRYVNGVLSAIDRSTTN
jgi:transcription antitermination protein NusB